ncbi:prolyl 4-hydroxylase [Nesidiocoris tenuis]|uniref:procollagen-proline 4-dioxygenase n=1 Tax=Nesidiocoris tenuis TaxID=355587 RepID=A0ABN7ANK8_9HEMI|nr:prolyl 4-hydroxylase [Nesidiocoris tenuis]
MRLRKMYILGAWVIINCLCLIRAELYTAITDLEDLLDTEAMFMETLNRYIQREEKKLERLKRKAEEYKKEHSLASADVSEYLSNPINAYLLVKRLTTDWTTTESLMTDQTALDDAQHNFTEIKRFMKFPTDEDLTGAAAALIRLQDTYNMDTSSLAQGELMGVKYTTQLSASDCFELGRQSYNSLDYRHTVLWMTEALARQEAETRLSSNKTETPKWEILEYLAYSTYMEGDVKSALDMTNELLQIYPDHERAQGNKVYYLKALEKKTDSVNTGENVTEGHKEEKEIQDAPLGKGPTERELYEMACRGNLTPPVEITSQLTCYYSSSSPFARLARLKVEEAYPKPRILLFRDVMYDSEIEIIKRLATPRLRRATVQNFKTGQLETANYRISKSAWLNEEDDPIVSRVSRRVEDMTGLTTKTAEELQVVNYGIGGHYEPHLDFARKEETNAFKSLGTGNRIATVLFYMSDVAQGGATVFPGLQLALWPQKGTAAVWMNLLANGNGDFSTRHAACPVLAGSKWVSNKWLHELGQEILRPCSLDPSE